MDLQHINLYLLLPKKRKARSTVQWLAVLYIAFFALFIFYTYLEYQTKNQLVQALDRSEKELKQTELNLNALVKQYPSIDPHHLKKSIDDLRQELQSQAHVVHLLSQQTHFSDYMVGLARSATEGLWLTEIALNSGEPYIVLKGDALMPAIVQQFLEKLVMQPVFIPMLLELRELKQVTDDKGTWVHFEIATKMIKTI